MAEKDVKKIVYEVDQVLGGGELSPPVYPGVYGRPFVSKLWHDILAVFSHVYLQSFLLFDITCVFLPRILAFFLTKGHIYVHVVYIYIYIWGHRRLSYKRYRIIPSAKIPLMYIWWGWKVTSVWIKHGLHGRVNFERDLVLIHYPHSSGGCWLPYNGFVGIHGLSLERLCKLFHKCWPKQQSIQLEISVRQAKHDS